MRRIVAAILALVWLVGCAGRPQTGGKPVAVGAIYPLAFVLERVAGGRVDVRNLTSPGGEPHDLELSARQVELMRQAALVVYVGGGFQPAVERVVEQGLALDVLSVPSVNDNLRRTSGQDDVGARPGRRRQGTPDPHVWMDPVLMQAVARAIEAEIARIDPDHADEHTERAQDLVSELQALDGEFNQGLRQCDRRELVTSHSAFGYLADRYGLTEVGIAGLTPEDEPSPQRMADVARFVRERGVTTIFFEKLVSPRVAESLAREVGVRAEVLDPIEGKPEDGDYLHAMRGNLQSLRNALACR